MFIHCLIKANWEDRDWMGYRIKRSQFATSYEKLSIQTGLSVKEVRTTLTRLEASEVISRKTIRKKGKSAKLGRGFSLITICNYDRYQAKLENVGTQRAPKGHSKGNQRALTNNNKQVKQVEQDIIIRAAEKNLEHVLANQKYIGTITSKFSISIDRLKELYREFNDHLVLTSDEVKTETEYTTHFLNWYTKKYKLNRRTGETVMQDRNAL